ncbi:37S ribosomal protein S9, mitochondrial [Teratosphaeriaceae sp. CCFEE 6253]|nr:37S ribosomal protein S9, mitochondrial [Teratosphaeriaceae sp. CCFEE 6253]
MESPVLRTCLRRTAQYRPSVRHRPQCRFYATPAEPAGDIRAAPPIRFSSNPSEPRAQFLNDDRRANYNNNNDRREETDLRTLRIVPASPSYFTATPQYTDDFLHLTQLLRRHQLLPLLPPGQAPRVAWKTISQYKTELAEPVRSKGFNALLDLLKRLNYIHPSLIPDEVSETLEKFKRDVQPYLNDPKPITVSAYGVSIAVGRRKSSSAKVYLVEGTGECMINGRPLSMYFGRLHDRESAVWALKTTQRLDKYNIWALTKGGGTTSQAEAITLAAAKALLAHEPDLKPALRRAGCVTRNPKRVERKKPGKLKARKMPAWVKR